MRKFILLTCLLIPLSVLAQEDYSLNGVDEPQWKSFAPPAYIDVKAPRGFGKFNDTASYWYKRRVEFENGIEKCREVEKTEAKVSCYQELKVKQYQKNSDYNARLEAIERAKHLPQEMQDPTNNMVPIGGYLNNMMKYMPNEFR
ncbi:hypothetical protein IJ750_02245 [bacterium]|nr:hypothetical protein [bacterium]